MLDIECFTYLNRALERPGTGKRAKSARNIMTLYEIASQNAHPKCIRVAGHASKSFPRSTLSPIIIFATNRGAVHVKST